MNVRPIIDNPEGGTLDLRGYPLPDNGYFVGGACPPLVFPSAESIDPVTLGDFIGHLRSAYVGWWTDEETGKVYIDGTDWISTQFGAEYVARQRGEIAFWDIGAAREIRLRYVSGEPETRPFR